MTSKKLPDTWEEFKVMYNKLDSETRIELGSVLYDFLVMEGKMEPSPEVKVLENQLKEELHKAEEHEKKAEELKKEIERLKGKNPRNAGRKPKDEKWKESFDKFTTLYKSNYTMDEIMKQTGISRRTYFRYKKLYETKKESV